MLTLRGYQQECVDSILHYFMEGNKGNPLVATPCGTGKSLILAGAITQFMRMFPGQRFIAGTHVKELIIQDYNKLVQYWPTAPVGIYSAGLKQKDVAHDIIIGGIQSMVKVAHAFGWRDIFFIDEAHLLSPNDASMYQVFIAILKEINPNLKVVGLTASPYRMGQGMLTDAGLFTDICIDLTGLEPFNRFIEEGFLSPLVARPTDIKLDITGIHISNGDYVQGELTRAMDEQHVLEPALKEDVALFLLERRKCGLVFLNSNKHVNEAAEILNGMGLPTVPVHNGLSTKERDRNIKAWTNSEVAFATSQNMLTTGVDCPQLDFISDLAATVSTGRHVQKYGRGTRLFDWYKLSPDEQAAKPNLFGYVKKNCRAMDHVGNVANLGPINDPVIPKRKGDKGGVAPIKICETEKLVPPAMGCGGYNHTSVRYCDECGAEFAFKPKVYGSGGTEEIIRGTAIPESIAPQIETFDVNAAHYSRQEVKGGKAMLKATYQCGLRSFSELKGFEHGGFAGKIARDWWRMRSTLEPPVTIDEALLLNASLSKPKTIDVNVNSKFGDIVGYGW